MKKPPKKEVVFDIEADNLLENVTKVYVIACVDVDGKNQKVFTDYSTFGVMEKAGSLEDGVRYLTKADRVICHNIVGYDSILMNRFWPEIWNLDTVPLKKHWDTLVQSKAQHYDRPRLKGTKSQHGLEYYGLLFKHPKPPIDDWSEWNAEKLNRVVVDVEINRQAYHYLNKEAQNIGLDFTKQIRRTQGAQYWYARQEEHGWIGDADHMERCVKDLDEKIDALASEIEPKLPPILKPKAPKCTWEDIRDKWPRFFRKVPSVKYDEDGKPIKPARMPTIKIFLKSGKYDRHTAKHFDIDQDPEKSGRLVRGPYTKIEITPAKMSQHDVVKRYLLSLGWVPTQWNYAKDKKTGKFLRDDSGNLIKKSPKLTEDSFDSIEGELGQKIARFNTYVHRRRTFKNEKDDTKGWLNQLREGSGRLPAGAMAWATSTGRAAQFNLVNVPSTAALYGHEMRGAWICAPEDVLVSVDMDSAQLRLLANYMGDPEFTKAVMEGTEEDADGNYVGTDAHTFNARFFGLIEDEDWRRAIDTQDKELIEYLSGRRKKAKNGIYALLFGAGDEKFANTLGYKTAAQGKQVKETYFTRLPKIEQLFKKLKRQWEDNPWRKGGFIEVAGGTWVWCPSEHKLLNYLLMGSEAALQNEAMCWANAQMMKRNLNGHQLAAIHDELTFEFPLTEEREGRKLLTEMYGEASRRMGLEVLVTGTAMTGRNWAEIH